MKQWRWLPDEVNIYGAHCAPNNHPVSPLWVVNRLIRGGKMDLVSTLLV